MITKCLFSGYDAKLSTLCALLKAGSKEGFGTRISREFISFSFSFMELWRGVMDYQGCFQPPCPLECAATPLDQHRSTDLVSTKAALCLLVTKVLPRVDPQQRRRWSCTFPEES